MRKQIMLLYTEIQKIISLTFKVKNIMVFSSNSDFCDNSKALYDFMIKNNINEKYKIFWIVKELEEFSNFNTSNVRFVRSGGENLISKLFSDIRINFLLYKTKYYFFSHTNYSRFTPKKNQTFYNLTHGTPLKNTIGRHHGMKFSTHVLSTSDFSSELTFATFDDGELEKMRILGFPRNDKLFDKISLNDLKFLELKEGKVIIWMPTFRRHRDGTTNDSGKSDKEIDIPIIDSIIGWERLNDLLVKTQTNLIVKPHPAQDMKFFSVLKLSNIVLVTNADLAKNKIDLYSLLSFTDALITDYSSVYMDYLLLDRPIGFTVDDFDSYTSNLGFMVENPLDLLPGEKIKNIGDFLLFIKNLDEGNDMFMEDRTRIKELFNKYTDGNSSSRIFNDLNL